MAAKVDISSGDGGADKWLLRKEDFDGWFVPDNPYDMFRLAVEIANKKYSEEKAEKNRERRSLREQETSERIERLRTVYWEAAEQRRAEERRAQEQRERRAERDRERRKRQRRSERDRERRKRQRREREAARREGDGEKEPFSAAEPPLLMEQQPLQRVAADDRQTHNNIGDVLQPPAGVKAYIEGDGGSDVGRSLREQEATERTERLRREYRPKAEEGGALPRGGDRERERERDHHQYCIMPLSSEAGDAPLPLSAPPALRAVASENGDGGVLLPAEVKAYIDRVGGSEAKLVMDKCLFETDVQRSQNRLSIPLEKVRTEFLSADEKEFLGDGVTNMGKPIPAIQVMLLQPNMMSTARPIILKRWDMMRKAASGKTTNPMYVLGTHWNDVVKANNLRAGQPIALWSFRCEMRLCFALVVRVR